MDSKLCNKCYKEKELTAFHKNRSSKDGHQTFCSACKSKSDREYREKNKDSLKVKKSEYYYRNREAILVKSKKWWDEGGSKICAEYHRHKLETDEEYRARAFNYSNLWKKRQKEILSDYYILELILKGNGLEREDIPQELIEAKRQHIQLKRNLQDEVSLENKRCAKCKKIKIISEFHKNKSKNDNLTTECKQCVSKYNKQYQRINKRRVA